MAIRNQANPTLIKPQVGWCGLRRRPCHIVGLLIVRIVKVPSKNIFLFLPAGLQDQAAGARPGTLVLSEI